MFSSNQKFAVSCDARQLEDVVMFALRMEDDRGVNRTLAYQITQDGRFVLGWYNKEPEDGWKKFPFENPSIGLIVELAKQTAKEHPAKHKEMWDGLYEDGYLVERTEKSMGHERDGIREPFYGIISVRSFSCFYAK